MQIKKYSPVEHKVKAVVYGPSGVGKTTFGSTCPKPIFASAESGLLSIASSRPDYVAVKRIEDLKELLAHLQKPGHGYESVVIDSITEISEIIKADIEKRTGKSMQIQDYGTLGKSIRQILRGFRDLPMHVLFIALEKAEKDEERIIRYVPDLNGKSATDIAQFMDIVGYLTMDPQTLARKVLTQSSPKLLTKDRTGVLKDDVTPDFGVWVSKATGVKLGKETIVHESEQPVAEAFPEEPVEKPVERAANTPASPKAPKAVKTAQEAPKAVKEVKEAAKTENVAVKTASTAQVARLGDEWLNPALPANILENRIKEGILQQTMKMVTGREVADSAELTPAEIEQVIQNVIERNADSIDPKAAPKKLDNGHKQAIKDFLKILGAGMNESQVTEKLKATMRGILKVEPVGSSLDGLVDQLTDAQRATLVDFLREKANAKKDAPAQQ
jgi:hypothetical protein